LTAVICALSLIFSEAYNKRMNEAQGVPGETVPKTAPKTAPKTVSKTVSKTAQKILELIKENSSITLGELAEKVGITKRGVKWQIEQLKNGGIIQKELEPIGAVAWEIIDSAEIIRK